MKLLAAFATLMLLLQVVAAVHSDQLQQPRFVKVKRGVSGHPAGHKAYQFGPKLKKRSLAKVAEALRQTATELERSGAEFNEAQGDELLQRAKELKAQGDGLLQKAKELNAAIFQKQSAYEGLVDTNTAFLRRLPSHPSPTGGHAREAAVGQEELPLGQTSPKLSQSGRSRYDSHRHVFSQAPPPSVHHDLYAQGGAVEGTHGAIVGSQAEVEEIKARQADIRKALKWQKYKNVAMWTGIVGATGLGATGTYLGWTANERLKKQADTIARMKADSDDAADDTADQRGPNLQKRGNAELVAKIEELRQAVAGETAQAHIEQLTKELTNMAENGGHLKPSPPNTRYVSNGGKVRYVRYGEFVPAEASAAETSAAGEHRHATQDFGQTEQWLKQQQHSEWLEQIASTHEETLAIHNSLIDQHKEKLGTHGSLIDQNKDNIEAVRNALNKKQRMDRVKKGLLYTTLAGTTLLGAASTMSAMSSHDALENERNAISHLSEEVARLKAAQQMPTSVNGPGTAGQGVPASNRQSLLPS